MRLAWHIARKDLRRLRVAIALWTALIAAKLGVGVMLIYGVGGRFDPLRLVSNALAGLEAIAGCLIVAAFVHGDVLTGSSSFWMTRPVSSGRLIGGKITGLAVVLGAIPLAMLFPWWLVCGYGAKEMLMASVETILVNSLFVCASLPLATLTDGLGRYLFGALVFVTAIICVSVTAPFIPGAGLVAVLVTVGGGGIVAGLFHLWNRRVALGGVLLSTCVMAAVMVTLVEMAVRYRPAPSESLPGPSAERVTLSLAESGAQDRVSSATLALGFRATGVPKEFVLGGYATHRWTWSDGGMVEKKSAFSADFNPIISGRSYFEEDTLRKRPFRIALGLAVESDERSSILTSAVIVPREFIDRVRRDAPQYQLSAEIQLMRPVVMGEKPARTSERIVSGRETTRIIAGVNGSEFRSAPFFRLQEYQPTIFGTENGMGGVGPFDFGFWPKRSYFLVDRKLGYLSTNFFSEYDARRTTVVRIGTVGIVWRQLSGSPSESFPSRAPSPPEDLSIAKVEFRAVERFTKELRVDQFQLGLSQRRGRAAR